MTFYPDASLALGRDLLAHLFSRLLAFKLCKEQHDVERQAPHGCGGVEGLGDRHKGHLLLNKQFDQFGKVGKRP